MRLTQMEALRDAAAERVLQTIRRHRAAVPRELKPLLAHMEKHLFDAEWTVTGMKRACKVRDNSVSTRFKKALGLKFKQYMREHRMEVGAEMLRSTRLEVCLIAELVGYNSQQHFTNHFGERFGKPPGAYRTARAEPALGLPHIGNLPGTEEPTTLDLRQALEGYLEPERGAELLRRLEAFYRPAGEAAGPRGVALERVWQEIRNLPPEARLPADREGLVLAGRALFDLLRQMCLEVGRRNRRLGVRVAELALASLDGSAAELGDELPGLKALGWACVGNARRLALDFTGAEEAFELAVAEWGDTERCKDPVVEAEICFLKSALRSIQHRFEEALKLADDAVDFLQITEDPRLLAKTLIVRANITGYEGNLDASTADLRQALELVDEDDRRLRLSICHNLAAAHVDACQYVQAAELLPLARRLCATHDETLTRYQLRWLEGRIASGLGNMLTAEARFLEARDGFMQLGERGYVAVVALDLALIYSKEERQEVVDLAAEAIPVLESFKIRREALALARVLAEAVARGHVHTEVLQKVRMYLDQLLRDPAVRLPR